jgi:hypothetical protein
MRPLFTWLMVICTLAGLNARVLAADSGRVAVCDQAADSCCHDHQDAPAPEEHHHDGDDCPVDHHHHIGCCAQAQPLTVENNPDGKLGVPGSSLLGVLHESEVPPEEPVLGSEKPPLI